MVNLFNYCCSEPANSIVLPYGGILELDACRIRFIVNVNLLWLCLLKFLARDSSQFMGQIPIIFDITNIFGNLCLIDRWGKSDFLLIFAVT